MENQIQKRFLSDLVEISIKLNRARTPDALYDIFWQYVNRRLGVSTFFIGLYDWAADKVSFPRVYDESKPVEMPPRLLGGRRYDWGISGFVVKTRKELYWPERTTGEEICGREGIHSYPIGTTCESCLYIPLKVNGKTAGLISFQSMEPHAFSNSAKNVMRSLVNLLSVALEKHELLKIEKDRVRQAELLQQAARNISAELDLDKIYGVILEELAKIVQYDVATVQIFHSKAFEIVDSKGFSNPAEIRGQRFSIEEDNPNRQVFRTRKSLVVVDAPAKYPDFNRPPHNKTPIRSWMGLPMRVGGKWVGMLDISRYEPGAFNKGHQRLAETLAANAALAIKNAQSLDYIESLLEGSTQINDSIDVKEVLKKIVNNALTATQAMSVHLLLMVKGEAPRLLEEAGTGTQELVAATAIRPNGISWQVFNSQKPRYKSDIAEDDPEINPKMIEQKVRATACLPLKVSGKCIGVLWIHFAEPREFTRSDKHTLELFASQSALAYERLRLLDEIQLSQKEAQAIASKSVEGSHDVTLKAIVAAVRKVMSCDSVTLYKYNAELDEFEFPPVLQGDMDYKNVMALQRVSQRSIVRTILSKEGVYMTDDAQGKGSELTSEYDRKAGFAPYVVREKIVTVMAFPLKVGSRKVGVMFINYHSKHPFSASEKVNAALFANQAAIIIHNSQLYTKTSQQAVTLQAIYDAGLGVTTNYSLEDILDRIACQAWSLTGRYGLSARLCTVSLVEGDLLKIAAVYRPGGQVASLETLQEINLQGDKIGVTGRAVKTLVSQLVEDVRKDADYRVFDPKTRSELAVPVLVEGIAIGVINLEHSHPGAFDKEDVRSVEALALQAGIAVQNARLLRGKGRGLERGEESVSEVLGAIISASKPELILQTIVDSIQKYLSAWRAVALVIDEEAQEHRVLAQTGFIPALQAAIPIRQKGVSMTVMRSRAAFYKTNIQEGDPDVHPETFKQGARAVACLPLKTEEKCLGVLWIHFKEPHEFTEEEKNSLELYAKQSALVYEQALKMETARQTKQEFSARSTLTWMNVLGNTWRHSAEKTAYAIRDTVDLILARRQLKTLSPSDLETYLGSIKDLANNLGQSPMMAVPSTEEGVTQIDIGLLFRDRLKILQTNPLFEGVDISYENQAGRPLYIRANPNWLRRALDILIENAVGATAQQKERRLGITLLEKISGVKNNVEVRIADNGPGIPDSMKQYILRIPVPKRKGERGSGMGLIMARTIAQTYGGDLTLVESNARGTIFAITLPLIREDSDVAS